MACYGANGLATLSQSNAGDALPLARCDTGVGV
jgi:hypothetical protein